jgi:hypothetical protein
MILFESLAYVFFSDFVHIAAFILLCVSHLFLDFHFDFLGSLANILLDSLGFVAIIAWAIFGLVLDVTLHLLALSFNDIWHIIFFSWKGVRRCMIRFLALIRTIFILRLYYSVLHYPVFTAFWVQTLNLFIGFYCFAIIDCSFSYFFGFILIFWLYVFHFIVTWLNFTEWSSFYRIQKIF